MNCNNLIVVTSEYYSTVIPVPAETTNNQLAIATLASVGAVVAWPRSKAAPAPVEATPAVKPKDDDFDLEKFIKYVYSMTTIMRFPHGHLLTSSDLGKEESKQGCKNQLGV